MQWFKQLRARIQPGLAAIVPGIAHGILGGAALALFLPSIESLGSLLLAKLRLYQLTKLTGNPWSRAIVAPEHLVGIATLTLFTLVFIWRNAVASLLRRCYSWTIYEATVLWIVCTFVISTTPHVIVRILGLIAGALLTCVIAWFRTPLLGNGSPRANIDRPIKQFTDDKLDRKPLILSLVKRLVFENASVVALIGAYGDGKTSILNLLEQHLKKDKTVVVRFKSSLPGDDLTLVSTLFNSIGAQLRTRFFVRRLRNVFKRFARRVSGLVPYAPSGLREMFGEPSQQDELQELTDRLATLPLRRVVVLLDDMDRMQGGELRMLLKIIRATEDYPKLSFVCAFNKKALVSALIRHQAIDRVSVNFTSSDGVAPSGTATGEVAADDTRAGYEYLEKFFPVQIPVPKLDDGQVAKEFDFRFNQFVGQHGLSLLPKDTAAFEETFRPFWKPFFLPSLNNLRKINSYFNALNASFELVNGEVHLIDFMVIELLRQVEAEVYEEVFKNRSLFYYPEMDITRWDEREIGLDDAKKKKRLDAAFERVFRNLQGPERDFALSLLGSIFPKVNEYHDGRSMWSVNPPSEIDADKNRRIYHPDHFTTYFSLHVQEGYVSNQELANLIATANSKPSELEAKTYFVDYLQSLKGLKKYRFFEKMMRLGDKLEMMQARALALAIAAESRTFTHDDFDLGEFGTAIRLELILANRFKDDIGITQIVKDVILQSTSNAFAQRVFRFATDKNDNKIFDKWDFVNLDEVNTALAQRMKARYFVGGAESIYATETTYREWQALIWWSRVSNESHKDVREYLEDEFERRPASIGKHLQWLQASIGNVDGEKIVDDLFPLSRLAQLAEKHGTKAYSSDSERLTVMSVIERYGKSSKSTQESENEDGNHKELAAGNE